jgi:FMN reductase
MKVIAVAGNPKPQSRTLQAAMNLAARVTASDPANISTVDLVSLGPRLLSFQDTEVKNAVDAVREADLVIFSSPTFKATYSGLLKLFLDQFETNTGLKGVVAVPLMLGAAPHHALAPELTLKPVLVELGATCPTPAVYQIDRTFEEDPSLDKWITTWGPILNQFLEGKNRDHAS